MWVPSHVEFVGNELVNGEARYTLLNGSIFDRLLGKTSFVKGIAGKVRFATHWVICSLHSMESTWFEGQKEEKSFLTSVSIIMSGHSSGRSNVCMFEKL
jgi:hypothetical protein